MTEIFKVRWWLAWTTLLCTESKSLLIRVNQCNQCNCERLAGLLKRPKLEDKVEVASCWDFARDKTSTKSKPKKPATSKFYDMAVHWRTIDPQWRRAYRKIFTHPIRLKIRHFGIVDFNVFSATYPLTWTKDTAKLTLFIRPSLNGQV